MYQDHLKDAKWDPLTDDWLKFVPLQQAIDAAIPQDVANLGAESSMIQSFPEDHRNLDVGMVFLKGIMYGALASLGAREVFYVCTDDIPFDLYGAEPGTYPEDSYAAKLVDLYHDSAQHDSWYRISHEQNEGEHVCGYDYNVSIYRKIFVTSDSHWVHLVWIQMEAEGGPPGDWFFVKGDALRVTS